MPSSKAPPTGDPRLRQYRRALRAMSRGEFQLQVPAAPDEVGQLGSAIQDLAHALERRFHEVRALADVTEQMNAGLVLDEVLELVYRSFRTVIPYDRIGFSLLEEGPEGILVMARWARSEAAEVQLGRGFAALLRGSSLEEILDTLQPRILNDLEAYLAEHPTSVSTRKVVAEGMRSSITFPLVAMGKPLGFMFFSSMARATYEHAHVALFQQIAGQLAQILEKSRLYQHLLELDGLKNRFLGMAAHDLRNPLTVVQGYLSLFRSGTLAGDPEEQQEYFGVMAEACDRMVSLVNDLVDFSAIEAGHLSVELAPQPLGPVLQAALRRSSWMARPKDIALAVDVPTDLPDVRMDAHRVDQVLSNLVSNAVKFSHPGTTVRLAARAAEHEVLVSVTDHGQGIPDHELPLLFKDFGRTSVRPTSGEVSTGLGLAIVKRLVEAHGGRITVTSTVGQGSTFTFALPRA